MRQTHLRRIRPSSLSMRMCSTNAPCSARTPIFMAASYRITSRAANLFFFLKNGYIDTDHGLSEAGAQLGQNGGIPVIGRRLYDGFGAQGRLAALEYPRAHEDTVHTELHRQGRIRRSGKSASGKVDHRQATQGLCLFTSSKGAPRSLA